ncbi:hypothetical protein EUTSA_v10012386mg, partial [Eutrema salsugineum]
SAGSLQQTILFGEIRRGPIDQGFSGKQVKIAFWYLISSFI